MGARESTVWRRSFARSSPIANAVAILLLERSDEAAGAEEEDLHAVHPSAEKDEKRPAVGVGLPQRPYERHEPVVSAPKIDRRGREHDLDAGPETQHARVDAETIAATCSGPTAPRRIIRVGPASTTTSSSTRGVSIFRVPTTTGRSLCFDRLPARRRSSDRHQIRVRSRTPYRRAISFASPPRASSSIRSAHHPASCFAMGGTEHGAAAIARRPSPAEDPTQVSGNFPPLMINARRWTSRAWPWSFAVPYWGTFGVASDSSGSASSLREIPGSASRRRWGRKDSSRACIGS